MEAGVRAVLVVSADPKDWPALVETRPLYGQSLFRGLGIHPFHVSKITPNALQSLLEELEFRVLGAKSRLQVIGECGLDFNSTGSDEQKRSWQITVFRAQLELARRLGMPLSIHCVRAHGVMLELLSERPTPASALHAFSGSAEVAHRLVGLGHYISFAANLQIPGARRVVAAARAVPDERLLIETDSPDQLPLGRRRPGPGTRSPNEPAFVVDVARALARVRGQSLAELAHHSYENGFQLFDRE